MSAVCGIVVFVGLVWGCRCDLCNTVCSYVLDGPYMSKALGGCLDEDVW